MTTVLARTPPTSRPGSSPSGTGSSPTATSSPGIANSTLRDFLKTHLGGNDYTIHSRGTWGFELPAPSDPRAPSNAGEIQPKENFRLEGGASEPLRVRALVEEWLHLAGFGIEPSNKHFDIVGRGAACDAAVNLTVRDGSVLVSLFEFPKSTIPN